MDACPDFIGVVNPPIAVAGKNFRLPLRGVGLYEPEAHGPQA